MSALVWYFEQHEDGPFSVLGRVTSLAGSGEEVIQGEGPVIQQADVSTITAKVFELADQYAEAGTEVTPAPTLTAAANIFDTLRTAGWRSDPHGYNFRHDLGAAYLADPGEWRCVEYKITLTGGEIIWIEARIKTRGKLTS